MVPGSTLIYGSSFISVTRRPRASSKHPIEEAARPLPRLETTPPVTKMYLGIRSSRAKGKRKKENRKEKPHRHLRVFHFYLLPFYLLTSRFGRIVGFFLVVIDSPAQVLPDFNSFFRRGIQGLLQSHHSRSQYSRSLFSSAFKFVFALYIIRLADLIKQEQHPDDHARDYCQSDPVTCVHLLRSVRSSSCAASSTRCRTIPRTRSRSSSVSTPIELDTASTTLIFAP